MAQGALVPDDIVVSIVEQRIEQPDARKGFILDGFPRTQPQAEALDRMLAKHGLALDGVIELKVDEAALIRRIESRIAEMTARGEALRPDDNPEVLHRRLTAYRAQTEPLIAYYRRHGMLRTIDGMAPIPEVARQIEQALSGGPAPVRPAPAKVKPKSTVKADKIGKKSKKSRTWRKTARKPAPTARKRPAAKRRPKAKTRVRAKATAPKPPSLDRSCTRNR